MLYLEWERFGGHKMIFLSSFAMCLQKAHGKATPSQFADRMHTTKSVFRRVPVKGTPQTVMPVSNPNGRG
jgi:hypothetical protein